MGGLLAQVTMDTAQDTITAMMQREEIAYRRRDYIQASNSKCACGTIMTESQQAALHLLEECAWMVTDPMASPVAKATVNKVPSVTCVQDFEEKSRLENTCTCAQHYPHYPSTDSLQFWREQMFDWSCMVADSYGVIDRTAVIANSFHLLDRYVDSELSSNSLPITREDFQLFSMTCLYISIKIMDGHKLTVDALVLMSRGFYKPQDIIATENDILKTLQWKVTPPTTIEYCRLLWEFFPTNQSWNEFEALCATIAEVSVASASFLECRNSVVALAVLVLCARYRGYSESSVQELLNRVQSFMKVDEKEYAKVYRQLKSLY